MNIMPGQTEFIISSPADLGLVLRLRDSLDRIAEVGIDDPVFTGDDIVLQADLVNLPNLITRLCDLPFIDSMMLEPTELHDPTELPSNHDSLFGPPPPHVDMIHRPLRYRVVLRDPFDR